MDQKRYHIVEFDDGLQVIPKNWFCDKEQSKVSWPSNFKNFKAYDIAVEKMKEIDPNESIIVSVKRIFGSTDNFQNAKLKLKDAERVSDLNSDVESRVIRKERQKRAARLRSSSNDSSDTESSTSTSHLPEKEYPLPPVKKSSIGTRHIPTKRLPSPDTAPQRKLTYIPPNKKKVNTNITDTCSSLPNMSCRQYSVGTADIEDGSASWKQNQSDFVGEHNLVRSITGLGKPPEKPSYVDEFQTTVLRKLADLKQKLSLIIVNQNDFMDQWKENNANVQYEATTQIDENVGNVMAKLPVSNDVELNDVEKAIVNADTYKKIVKELAKIGGNNLKSVTLNLVKRVFTNQVAQDYSWEGKKKKKRFCDLKICNAILDATRVQHNNATDCEIAQTIKDWLRHAAERARSKKSSSVNDSTSP